MELTSSEKREIVLDTLQQIKRSIENLEIWNEGIDDMNTLLMSYDGMQDLAGNCMTIMVICESFKQIDKLTNGTLLPLRPEIPWKEVFGLRNRIAHGYFDIDIDIISEVIKNDLKPLMEAVTFFIDHINDNQ